MMNHKFQFKSVLFESLLSRAQLFLFDLARCDKRVGEMAA